MRIINSMQWKASVASNNSTGAEREGGEERRDRSVYVDACRGDRETETGRGSEAKGSGGNARRIETERLKKKETETAYEMVLSETALRMRNAQQRRPEQDPARFAATPPNEVRAGGLCAQRQRYPGLSMAAPKSSRGPSPCLTPRSKLDAAEEADAEAGVDDGTNDGNDRDVGLVAAAQNCSTSDSAPDTSAGHAVRHETKEAA
ncbi:hypothetical protein FB451DRAFT_1447683 [Mycena latifolia]|nr:hypothetical protein FB451DRAFT_1447683 [Mycena latifolia]